VNSPIRRQPGHVSLKVTQQYSGSPDTTTSLKDITSSAEVVIPDPDTREAE
jgi:hypothetical protein